MLVTQGSACHAASYSLLWRAGCVLLRTSGCFRARDWVFRCSLGRAAPCRNCPLSGRRAGPVWPPLSGAARRTAALTAGCPLGVHEGRGGREDHRPPPRLTAGWQRCQERVPLSQAATGRCRTSRTAWWRSRPRLGRPVGLPCKRAVGGDGQSWLGEPPQTVSRAVLQ